MVSTLAYYSAFTLWNQVDSVSALNNFLQKHPTGNLASDLCFVTEQVGPNNQPIHRVTLKCEYHDIT